MPVSPIFAVLTFAAVGVSPVPFGNPHSFVQGFDPYALASGDLNGDGHVDIVVCTHEGAQGADPGNAEVFLNNGDGTFGDPIAYQVGAFPRDAEAADVNGDTFLDIITANDVSDDVSVLLNNGDGTFAPAASYAPGGSVFGVAIADYDGDGSLDIATSGEDIDALCVLLNNGAGVFSVGITPITIPEAATDITTADMNGDLLPDVVVATYSGFRVYLNNGSGGGEWGGISLGVNVDTGGTAWSIQAGEIDDQPGVDVIYTSWLTDEIYFHASDGAGGFLAPDIYPTGNANHNMDIGDIDGDGDLDFAAVVFGDLGEGTIVGTNDGTGGFATDQIGAIANSARACMFADGDGDGAPDLVVTSTAGRASFVVSFNAGDGRFALGTNIDIGTMGTDITSADFDNDGSDDFAYTSNLTNEIHVVMSNGDRTFGTLQEFPTNGGAAPWRIASGDLDNDGDPDIVAACGFPPTGAAVLLSNGDGTFAPAITYPAPVNYRNVDLGDVDGDGFLDIVGGGPGAVSGQAYVLYNNQDGTFGAAQMYQVNAQGDGAVAADFDGDGDVDIAIGDLNSKVAVILNNDDGTFSAPVAYTTGVFVQDLDSGDFDGDGDIDLATSNRLDSTVSVLLNNGDGTFAPRVDYPTGGEPFSLAIGDVDGDGALDIMCPLYSTNFMTAVQKNCLLLGNGDGTFGAPIYYPGYAPQFLAMGDFDGDGALDTVTQGDLFGADVLWGLAPAPTPCPGDTDGSGSVDVDDLNAILSAWGTMVPVGSPIDQANDDGVINVDDLNVVLSNWGVTCR
ncbi:MAG: VCBS repeat-containing protein [Phycisphaeraceae bacterium]|nr:VCBS repeat-containing protein [Phycisphaerales bacterium]MCB9842784.1 VCBS repeat-containing protein [Phycisphaeraceae bacterium]